MGPPYSVISVGHFGNIWSGNIQTRRTWQVFCLFFGDQRVCFRSAKRQVDPLDRERTVQVQWRVHFLRLLVSIGDSCPTFCASKRLLQREWGKEIGNFMSVFANVYHIHTYPSCYNFTSRFVAWMGLQTRKVLATFRIEMVSRCFTKLFCWLRLGAHCFPIPYVKWFGVLFLTRSFDWSYGI
jgi:hypothetical protein